MTDAVRSESTAITMAAKDWVDRYRSDRAEGTAEVLTFLLQSCGVTSQVVTPEECETTGADDIKNAADEAAQEEGLEEVLGGRTAAARHLRASYKEMWDKLIREGAMANILQGGFFLDKVVDLVIALSTSVVRDLRKVATVTTAQISISLLHVVATLEESRDTAAGQQAAEQAKKDGRGGKAAGDRANAFARQVQQATSAIRELLNYIESIFNSVFTIRFRDVDPEIRLAVVQGIGRWMQLLPATFLSSSYLKYVAWAVSDKDAAVRLEACSVLCVLYSHPGNAAQLREFTGRFSVRFQELMLDKDDAVAVAGVKLVSQLIRLGHFPVTVGSHVVRLMSDAAPALRSAAADLVAGMLRELGKEALENAVKQGDVAAEGGGASSRGGAKKNAGKKNNPKNKNKNSLAAAVQSPEECELAGVLRVLRMLAAEEAQLPESQAPPLAEGVVALVVGSLSHRAAALRDWQLMVDWLKSDFADEVFGQRAVSDLLNCFLAGLRCAAGSGVHHAAAGGRGARDKLAAARSKARQDATHAVQNDLQSLVQKFQSDPAEVATIVSLISELKLEVFSMKREEKKLAAVLTTVKDVFFKHADPISTNACADALVCCARTGPDTTRDAARAVLADTVSKTIAELQKAAAGLQAAGREELEEGTTAYRSSHGEEESAVLFAARGATCRAAALVAVHPSGFAESTAARESVNRILEVSAAEIPLPAHIVSAAACAALLVLVHDLKEIDADNPDLIALGQISESQAAFASQLEAIALYSNESDDAELCKGIAAVHADFMTVFSATTLPEKLQEVMYRPSDAAVTSFWKNMEFALVHVPGTPSMDEEHGAVGGGASTNTAVVGRRESGAGGEELPTPAQVVARLCATACVPQYRQLSAQLLSYWESPNAPEVGDIAKELIKCLKGVAPSHLPLIYFGALQASYSRCKEEAAAMFEAGELTPEQYNDEQLVLQPFLELSTKISHSLAGFNSPPTTVTYLAEEGAKWALEGAPDRLDFLQGASYFMIKVKGSAAAAIAASLEAAGVAAGAPDRESDEVGDDWDLFFQYCDVLREQAAKPTGGTKSRKVKSTATDKTAAAARRISFAPGAAGGGAGGSDSEEENEEDAVVAADARPRVSSAKKKKPTTAAAAAKKKVKKTAEAEAAAPQRASRHRGTQEPVVEMIEDSSDEDQQLHDDDDGDQGEDMDVDIMVAQRKLQVHREERVVLPLAPSESDEEEEQGEEEEDEVEFEDAGDIMPTEEQLPGLDRFITRGVIVQQASDDDDDEEEEEDEQPQRLARCPRRN